MHHDGSGADRSILEDGVVSACGALEVGSHEADEEMKSQVL